MSETQMSVSYTQIERQNDMLFTLYFTVIFFVLGLYKKTMLQILEPK